MNLDLTMMNKASSQNRLTQTFHPASRSISKSYYNDASLSNIDISTDIMSSKTISSCYSGADSTLLKKVKLIPVDCSFNLVSEKPHNAILLPDMLRKRRKVSSSRDVTVVFVIRRPGCGGCREHGLQLTELYDKEKVDCIGIIKETSPDVHEGLLEFYQDYYRFPIYKDEKWSIYEAMGNRKVSLWQLISNIPKMSNRFTNTNIQTKSMGGDHFTKGGILIFDKKRNLRYTYYEDFSELLDMDKIRQAIHDARKPLMEKGEGEKHWGSDSSTTCDYSERS